MATMASDLDPTAAETLVPLAFQDHGQIRHKMLRRVSVVFFNESNMRWKADGYSFASAAPYADARQTAPPHATATGGYHSVYDEEDAAAESDALPVRIG